MINVTTDSAGTTVEITQPSKPGLVLVPDPQWVAAPPPSGALP